MKNQYRCWCFILEQPWELWSGMEEVASGLSVCTGCKEKRGEKRIE